MQNILLSEIAKVHTPDGSVIRQSRVFLFDTWMVIFESQSGAAVATHIVPYSSWVQSRQSRTQPHRITDSSGGEWLVYRGGCGCGSPIKKVSARQAWGLVPEPEPVE